MKNAKKKIIIKKECFFFALNNIRAGLNNYYSIFSPFFYTKNQRNEEFINFCLSFLTVFGFVTLSLILILFNQKKK